MMNIHGTGVNKRRYGFIPGAHNLLACPIPWHPKTSFTNCYHRQHYSFRRLRLPGPPGHLHGSPSRLCPVSPGSAYLHPSLLGTARSASLDVTPIGPSNLRPARRRTVPSPTTARPPQAASTPEGIAATSPPRAGRPDIAGCPDIVGCLATAKVFFFTWIWVNVDEIWVNLDEIWLC
jgi:hypothetical protein